MRVPAAAANPIKGTEMVAVAPNVLTSTAIGKGKRIPPAAIWMPMKKDNGEAFSVHRER